MTLPPRFEQLVDISLTCCGEQMKPCGNLSLREAGAKMTMLGYECKKCFRHAAVMDCWPSPSTAMLDELDKVE